TTGWCSVPAPTTSSPPPVWMCGRGYCAVNRSRGRCWRPTPSTSTATDTGLPRLPLADAVGGLVEQRRRLLLEMVEHLRRQRLRGRLVHHHPDRHAVRLLRGDDGGDLAGAVQRLGAGQSERLLPRRILGLERGGRDLGDRIVDMHG